MTPLLFIKPIEGVNDALVGVQDGLAELGFSHGSGLAVALIATVFALATVPATRASQRAQAERHSLIATWFDRHAATAPGNGGDHYLAARRYAKEHAEEQVFWYLRITQLTALLWFVALAIWSRSSMAADTEILGLGAAGSPTWRAGAAGIGVALVAAIATTALRISTLGGTTRPLLLRPATVIPFVITLVVAALIPLVATWSWAVSVAATLVGLSIAVLADRVRALFRSNTADRQPGPVSEPTTSADVLEASAGGRS